jgi:hypothetical protein
VTVLGATGSASVFDEVSRHMKRPTEFESACFQFAGIVAFVRTFRRKPSRQMALAKPVAPDLKHVLVYHVQRRFRLPAMPHPGCSAFGVRRRFGLADRFWRYCFPPESSRTNLLSSSQSMSESYRNS